LTRLVSGRELRKKRKSLASIQPHPAHGWEEKCLRKMTLRRVFAARIVERHPKTAASTFSAWWIIPSTNVTEGLRVIGIMNFDGVSRITFFS
jgi:hypothetical protein